MVRIGVVGAGVIGLTSAILLQDEFPKAQVTIIADKFGQDTLSDGAAGIFRPGLQIRGSTPDKTVKWLKDSYEYFKKILKSEESVEAGIKMASGYIFSTKHPNIVRNPLLEPLAEEYRQCTKEELEIYNMKYGSFITTILTECRRYLPYVTQKFKSRGGKIIERHLKSLEEVADDFDVVCNCSGFGAKELCGDTAVTPLRGQIYKVNAPWVKHFIYVDYDTYIIPGFDLVTLGGTRQFDSYNLDVCKHDSAKIWEQCTSVLPSLKQAEVVREWVGWRPFRGTIRVEKELLSWESGKSLKVVHNYGHGGYGVMISPGTSMEAVSLVKESLVYDYPKSKL